MKIYLRDKENFNKETIEFYEQNFTLVNKISSSDVVVINDFRHISCPSKIVACNSTATDHIEAKEVISLRGEDLSDLTAVAELTLGMAIYTTRIFKREEVMDKTLGVVGLGRIGEQLVGMADKMSMKLKYIDHASSNNELKNLLRESDIVSLHITADEENRNFIDREKFEMMKDGAIFLNSARPWLVDRESFKWALDNKLSGAWEDFETDLKHDKLITTPHLGGSTKESRKKSELILAKKLYGIRNKKR